ncbi:hypothetical protein HDV05_003156, partial [Chytridiales sp. JEL 0842]
MTLPANHKYGSTESNERISQASQYLKSQSLINPLMADDKALSASAYILKNVKNLSNNDSSQSSLTFKDVFFKEVRPTTHSGWTGCVYEKGKITIRSVGRRKVMLFNPMDVVLFDRILVWKAHNPSQTRNDAWDLFAGHTISGRFGHVDAMISLIYGVRRYDYILKFRQSEDQRVLDLRAAFERKVLKKGLILEIEWSVEDPNEYFLKVLAPFSVLCNEAQKTKLKLPLKVNEIDKENARKLKAMSRSSLTDPPEWLKGYWEEYVKAVFGEEISWETQAA